MPSCLPVSWYNRNGAVWEAVADVWQFVERGRPKYKSEPEGTRTTLSLSRNWRLPVVWQFLLLSFSSLRETAHQPQNHSQNSANTSKLFEKQNQYYKGLERSNTREFCVLLFVLQYHNNDFNLRSFNDMEFLPEKTPAKHSNTRPELQQCQTDFKHSRFAIREAHLVTSLLIFKSRL